MWMYVSVNKCYLHERQTRVIKLHYQSRTSSTKVLKCTQIVNHVFVKSQYDSTEHLWNRK
jgi:hypothetical protein